MPTGIEETLGALASAAAAAAEAGAVLGEPQDDARQLAERSMMTQESDLPDHVVEGSDDGRPGRPDVLGDGQCLVDGGTTGDQPDVHGSSLEQPAGRSTTEPGSGSPPPDRDVIELDDEIVIIGRVPADGAGGSTDAESRDASVPTAAASEQDATSTDQPADPAAPSWLDHYFEVPSGWDYLRWLASGGLATGMTMPMPQPKLKPIVESLLDAEPPPEGVQLPGDRDPAQAPEQPGLLEKAGGLAGVDRLGRDGAELAHLLALDEHGLTDEQKIERNRRISVLSVTVAPDTIGLVLGVKNLTRPSKSRGPKQPDPTPVRDTPPSGPPAPPTRGSGGTNRDAAKPSSADRKVDRDVDEMVERGIVEEARSTSRPTPRRRPRRAASNQEFREARPEFDRQREAHARRLGVDSGGQVHHAVELQVLKRYPGVYSKAELNAAGNMRGIKAESAGKRQLHNSKIREVWDRKYRELDAEISRRGLRPGTKEYNETVRRHMEDGKNEIDFTLGQFFTENRNLLDWTPDD